MAVTKVLFSNSGHKNVKWASPKFVMIVVVFGNIAPAKFCDFTLQSRCDIPAVGNGTVPPLATRVRWWRALGGELGGTGAREFILLTDELESTPKFY